MAAEEEVRARAVLAEMQMRILQGPHAALGLEDTASAEQVRAAFLQLTKQFHPARFGRMSAEVHKIANEVFLGIKGAHDQLVRMLGSSGRTPLRASSSPGFGAGTVRGTGVVSAGAPRAGTPAPLARGTDRASTSQSTRQGTPPAGTNRAPSALATPSSGTPRATSANTTPSSGTPRSTSANTTPSSGTTHANTPASGIPVHERTTGPLTTPLRPSMAPTPPTQRAGTPPVTRPGTPPTRPTPTPFDAVSSPTRPGTPAPFDAVNPPTVRYAGVQPQPPRTNAPALNEQGELEQAMDLLSSKHWTAARQALHALAAKLPQSKQYRALLCYARGREAQAAGRNDDAAQEFQRALQLAPDLADAKQALSEVQRRFW